MDLIVMPNSKEEIKKCHKLVEGYILSLDKLSVNVNFSHSLDDLLGEIDFLQKQGKKVFVSLNKNMHNSDLEHLKSVMKKLDEKDIDGILFYDVALVNIKLENKLKVDLVWNQEHMTTNYMTSEFWYDNGVSHTFLSYEITKEEINEISSKSRAKTMVPIFGYQPIFTSKRMLLSYYKEVFDVIDSSEVSYIHKEGNDYPILERNDVFSIFTAKIFNGISYMPNISADYFVFNSIFLDSDEVYEILSDLNKLELNEASIKIDDNYNTDLGFLDKKTVYKVKK